MTDFARGKKAAKIPIFFLQLLTKNGGIGIRGGASESEPQTAMPVNLLPKLSTWKNRRRRQQTKSEGSPIGADGVVLAPTPPTPGSTDGHDIGGTTRLKQ
jgi:hypothetical protein